MKERPTDKDLIKQGAQRKVSPVAGAKSVVGGVVADLARGAERLWRRLRR